LFDCDREQAFLLPPSLRDWLPEDHLAWFVIEAVGRLDLTEFYAAYRAGGHGLAAYEPSMMVSLVLYAYSTDERSSRGIERRCRQDVAYRVITGNQVPDHATIARFIRRHQQSLNELFGAVLRLCARAGLVNSGVVAVDGTKLTASASSDSNVDYDRIAREIIAEAIATDEAEDEQHAMRAVTSCRRSFTPKLVGASGLSASSRASRPSRRLTRRGRTSALSLTMSSILSGSVPTVGGVGCGRLATSSSASGGMRRRRPRARARSGCGSPLAGWRTSLPLNAAETGNTSASRASTVA
jgi:transposase